MKIVLDKIDARMVANAATLYFLLKSNYEKMFFIMKYFKDVYSFYAFVASKAYVFLGKPHVCSLLNYLCTCIHYKT